MDELDGQVTWLDLGISFGKMSPERSVPAIPKDQTSQPSSKKSSKSANRMPVCMSVSRTEDGQNPGAFMLSIAPGALLGEFTMHSFGESPREENASRLSQILEDSAPQKYCLSARACQGILNRANRRGKELPEELKKALEIQSLASKGGGITSQNSQGSNLSEDVSFTLNDVDRHGVAYGISAYESNAMKSSNPHSGIYKAETSRTLDLTGGSPACNQGGVAVVNAVDLLCIKENPDVNGPLLARGGAELEL